MPKPSTRERIVFSALQLFAQKGYGSTSIADIRQAADVHSGSLYHLFPGKQDVLLAVLNTYLAGIGPMLLDPAWHKVSDPVERIFALLARYRSALTHTECQYGCPIGSLALELHEPDPPVRALLAKNFDAWVRAIETCLDAACDRLPHDLNRHELAEFVLTTMEGAVMQARTFRDEQRFDRSVRQLRKYFDALLLAGAGSRKKSKVTVPTRVPKSPTAKLPRRGKRSVKQSP